MEGHEVSTEKPTPDGEGPLTLAKIEKAVAQLRARASGPVHESDLAYLERTFEGDFFLFPLKGYAFHSSLVYRAVRELRELRKRKKTVGGSDGPL